MGGGGVSRRLLENKQLVVDTTHFSGDFKERLLGSFEDLNEQTDGVLFHSENFQALSLMQGRYRERVKCVYIDPPYNTGKDGFVYMDQYEHSSWLTMMSQLFAKMNSVTSPESVLFASCDENELHNILQLSISIYGKNSLLENIIWNKRVPKNDKGVGNIHEYILSIVRDPKAWRGKGEFLAMRKTGVESVLNLIAKAKSEQWHISVANQKLRDMYLKGNFDRAITLYRDFDTKHRVFGKINMSWPNPSTEGPRYTVINPVTAKPTPIPERGWRWTEQTLRAAEQDGPEQMLPDGSMLRGRVWYSANEKIQPSSVNFLDETEDQLLRSVISLKSDGGLSLESMGLAGVSYPKPILLMEKLVYSVKSLQGLYLDYFAGSGTTANAIINLNREDGGQRKFLLVEMGNHFDTVLLPRIKKVTYTPEWKDGKPARPAAAEEAERSPRIVKYVRLESYEDTLNNLDLKRPGNLDLFASKHPNPLDEQYLLRYMLDVESRGSQSLLNIASFADPTAYKLKVKRPGSDETREVNVDLLETFNWLLGLTVEHISAPHVFSATFERDGEKRLVLAGKLASDAKGPFWLRTVTGTMPDGRKTLVIWRKLTGDIEKDNLVLDEWFKKQDYSTRDTEFDLVYVNGSSNLENLKNPDGSRKVRLLEEDFHRLMFEDAEAN